MCELNRESSLIEPTYLACWEDQCICNDYVISSSCCEDHHFSNVVRCQWFGTLVHLVGFRLVAVEPNNRELL